MIRAAMTETGRAFDLQGRTTRRRYLAFLFCAVVAFALLLTACALLLPASKVEMGVYLITAVFYLPITAAGVRRLHDVGLSGTLMLDPLKPLGVFLLSVLLLGASINTSFGAFVGLFTAFFFAKTAVALACIFVLGLIAATMMYFSNTMGQLLLPSEQGPNKYGPAPLR